MKITRIRKKITTTLKRLSHKHMKAWDQKDSTVHNKRVKDIFKLEKAENVRTESRNRNVSRLS